MSFLDSLISETALDGRRLNASGNGVKFHEKFESGHPIGKAQGGGGNGVP